ncbi:MAG: DUF1566 domain-containing protein [Methylococcaceae bacterium]|nr:DUF1566 domain-containing protein [Methylococcaceae bacterium]
MKQTSLFACLLFMGTATASQDPLSQSTYDAAKNLLTIPVVKAGRDYLLAELVDQGGYQFKLQKSASYAGIVPDIYPSFDAASSILTIPNLSALGKVYAVTLVHDGNWVFKLATATEVDTALKTDPLEAVTPKERYTINNDGTVTDKQTGLQWTRCSFGQTWNGSACTGLGSAIGWENAARIAYELSFAGHTDWRLPSIDELKSLVYCSTAKPNYWNISGNACYGDYQKPTLSKEVFPFTPGGVYWSSTNLGRDPGQDYNLTVSFNYGHVYYSYFSEAYELARFVRGESTIVPGPEAVGGFKE